MNILFQRGTVLNNCHSRSLCTTECVSSLLLLLMQWNQKHTILPEMHGARPCGHCRFLQKISSCSKRKPVFVTAVLAR